MVMSSPIRLRLQKVKAMSLGEIASRASYAALVAVERRRLAVSWLRPEAGRAHRVKAWRDVIEARRTGNRPRFFAGLADRGQMPALFESRGPYARQAEKAQRAAEAACRHEFEFFGTRFSYGTEIDWHADPLTGRRWPVVFHRDVPQIAESIGDIKYVWELNRHQFLIDLGKAYWLFGDSASASAAYALVRSWIAANPYGIGVNWSCALEPAFRVWSWLWAYEFCADDSALDIDTHALWLDSFHQHGAFLHRHLEYYSSPYNHLVGEAAALYALGVMFPEMPEARRWRGRGRRVLETRVRTEFHHDGGSVEQSTFYHHATLGFYILAALLGEANGEPFDPEVEASIERAIEFSMALMQPDGRVPSIGGADDGKCIRLEHLPFWDFRPFQAFGAVRLNRADFRFSAGEFFEDALWLLGPAGRDRFVAMESAPPSSASALRDSGYYVVRSRWSSDADFLCFDCGEQAGGLRRDDTPSAAHGHADCLSIVLWLRGRAVLVDPGFYCYNGDPAWEVYFRRTGAHNTARVDGREQSRHHQKMAWSRVFAPRIEAWSTREGGAVGGSHDGYARDGMDVIHCRAVWLHADGFCVICDQFTGSGSHELDINYQFAPGSARQEGDTALLFESAEVAWTGSTPLRPQVRCGESGPDGGWVAPSLGVKVAAPKLTLSATFTGPVATYLTVVAPRLAHEASRTIARAGAGQLAIGVRTGEHVQWITLPLTRPVHTADDLLSSLAVGKSVERADAAPAVVLEQCG